MACPEIADGANLGAIVRTSAALGASAVLFAGGRGADPFARKTIRASSGAIFRIPLFVCARLEAEVQRFREHGFIVLGTSTGKDSVNLDRFVSSDDTLVLFGPEEGGLV